MKIIKNDQLEEKKEIALTLSKAINNDDWEKVDGTAKQTKSSEIFIREIKEGKITAEWVLINNFFQF